MINKIYYLEAASQNPVGCQSLSTYIDGFLSAGFTLERLVEPTVTAEQLTSYPELDDECRVPNFIIYKLRKP